MAFVRFAILKNKKVSNYPYQFKKSIQVRLSLMDGMTLREGIRVEMKLTRIKKIYVLFQHEKE